MSITTSSLFLGHMEISDGYFASSVYDPGYSNGGSLVLQPNNVVLGARENGINYTLSFQGSGLTYSDNFVSASFGNPRWIPDRNYVDSSLLVAVDTTNKLMTKYGMSQGLTASMYYSDNFASASFGNPRWIPDRNYVDSSLFSAVDTTNKLITKYGISQGITTDFNQYTNDGTQFSSINSTPSGVKLSSNTNADPSTNNFVNVTPYGTLLGGISNYSTDFGLSINSTGVSSMANNAEGNAANPRWIPDKRYVDSTNLIHAGGVSIPINGGTNSVPNVSADTLVGSGSKFFVNLPGPGTYLITAYFDFFGSGLSCASGTTITCGLWKSNTTRTLLKSKVLALPLSSTTSQTFTKMIQYQYTTSTTDRIVMTGLRGTITAGDILVQDCTLTAIKL
jgi:hypothetical protein